MICYLVIPCDILSSVRMIKVTSLISGSLILMHVVLSYLMVSYVVLS